MDDETLVEIYRVLRKQNIQLLKIIAKNEDLDYDEMIKRYSVTFQEFKKRASKGF